MQKTSYVFGIWLVIMILFLLGISPGYAQEDDSRTLFTTFTDTFDGYLKHATAVRLEEPDCFISMQNTLDLRYSDWLGDDIRVTLEGRAVYDAVYDVEDDLNPEDEEDYRTYLDLKEAVLDITVGDVDLHVGKQYVIWGKTDGFRVTDVVNPLDLRDNASTEFLDQRISLWMANIEYYLTTDLSLQALIIPEMRFNKLPALPFPPGTVMHSTKKPAVNFENTEYGLKLSGYLKGWDFTLNYLYSWDDVPAFKQSFHPETGTLTISPEHQRQHILGGTFATVLWDGVIRGELAARVGKYFSVDDLTITDMVIEKTQLSYAFAFERDLFDINWLGQVLQETILDYEDIITTDEFQTYLTLRGAKDFLRETLNISAVLIYDVNNEKLICKPVVEYDYSDAIDLSFGIDVVVSDNKNVDQDEERAYAEVTYNF